MRIGIVCPYAFDVPGGVQFHVRDLAEHLLGLGHVVEVLAPWDGDPAEAPAYLTSTGRAVPVRYNGSVARLAFGPVTNARVRAWLDEGHFDVLHLHEPIAPSVTVIALWAASEPVVATFHTATERSRAMHAAQPLLRPSLEKIRGRIAVSEDARATVVRHLRGDSYVIPNGVNVAAFATALPDPRWVGTSTSPTLGFLGRIDEPRKGLAVLLAALPQIAAKIPGIRVVVAGPGDTDEAAKLVPAGLEDAVAFLGGVSDADKAAMLAAVDVYVAPHLGGESFGIVLVEAMAAGAPVLASDLSAFVRVLDDGAAGRLFPVGDAEALASAALDLLGDKEERDRLTAAGRARAAHFDWSVVADRILAVYEMAVDSAAANPVEPVSTGLWGRLVRAPRGGDFS